MRERKIFNEFHSLQKRRIAQGHRKGVKCKDCLCRECKSCRKREPPKRGGGGDATTGDYYCMACPHQKCATCKSMKPLATFPPVEGERRVRHETYVCTQCKSEKRKTCAECKAEKEINVFGASRSTRCKDCQFPSCAVCEHKRLPSEGAVREREKVAATGQANAMKIWYCAKCKDPVCQAALPSQQRCELCGETKDKSDFRWITDRYSPHCKMCENPVCVSCGAAFTGQRVPVVGTRWFCNAVPCHGPTLAPKNNSPKGSQK